MRHGFNSILPVSGADRKIAAEILLRIRMAWPDFVAWAPDGSHFAPQSSRPAENATGVDAGDYQRRAVVWFILNYDLALIKDIKVIGALPLLEDDGIFVAGNRIQDRINFPDLLRSETLKKR